MAANTGVLIIDAIDTPDSADEFPTHRANRGLGGLHHVADLTERDAITTGRRLEGLMAYVEADQKTYQLVNGTTNSDWVEFAGGSGVSTLQEAYDNSSPAEIQLNSTNGALTLLPNSTLTTTDILLSINGVVEIDDSLLTITRSGTSVVFQTDISGDTEARITISSDGTISWGSGSAATDTTLYRDSASVLRTGGALTIDNQLTVGNDDGSPAAGAIRWTGLDFEGYDGSTWSSFTSGGGITKYSALIGNGSENPITITAGTHGVSSDNQILAQAIEASTGTVVDPTITIDGSGNVTFDFGATPTTNQYRIVIVG